MNSPGHVINCKRYWALKNASRNLPLTPMKIKRHQRNQRKEAPRLAILEKPDPYPIKSTIRKLCHRQISAPTAVALT
ncbi:MAG: hypothetical protein PVH37_28000 [Desulfobacterales bacterium]|jgi:hypothetical protein